MRRARSKLCVAISAATPVWLDQLQQLVEDVRGRLGIEVAGRLVGQQQPRRVGERARDRRALLLAARQLRRTVIEPLAEPHHARAAAVARFAAARLLEPAIICGMTTFSSAENSGSSWWNW